MSYLPSHCDHSNWVKRQPQRQRFYAQLESFIWLLNLLHAGYCSCGRRRSTLSLVLDPRTTGVWFSKFLISDWSPKEGHTFSEISADICGDQHNGLYSSRESEAAEVKGACFGECFLAGGAGRSVEFLHAAAAATWFSNVLSQGHKFSWPPWLEESEAAEIKGACPRECFLAGGAATVPLM